MSNELEVSLNDVLDVAMERFAVEARTSIPGNVVAYRSYKPGTPEYVKVELGLKATLRDGTRVTLPEIDRVPILWPGGGGFHSGVDLKPGDEILCVISDRAIDAWLQRGGVQVPSQRRLHDLTDIVALPGLRSAKHSVTVKRGANTYYIGTDDGSPPWVRLQRLPLRTATIEAQKINIGEMATLGVARMSDSVLGKSVPTLPAPVLPMTLWAAAVTAALGTLTGGTFVATLDPSIGSISTASTKAFSE